MCFSSKNNLVRRVVDEHHHKASWEITKASRSRPCPDSGSMQQDTPRGAKSFRTCRNVGSFEALHWCTDSTDSTDSMSAVIVFSHMIKTWLHHRASCSASLYGTVQSPQFGNREKQQYQWFREIINVLRLGKKNRLCHSNTNWKANKIVIYQLYWTLSSYPFKSTLWSKSLCNSTNIFHGRCALWLELSPQRKSTGVLPFAKVA